MVSLRELELGEPEPGPEMGLLALQAPVPDVDLLRRLVAAGDLGELAHVPDLSPPRLLPVDPVEAPALALLDPLHLVELVFPAERAVCVEFHRHLHDIGSV